MKKLALVLAILFMVSFGLALSTSTRSASSTQTKKPTPYPAVDEEGEATPLRQMSELQQEHSSIYASYKGIGRKLTDLVRERGEDVTIGVDPPLQMTQPDGENGPDGNALEILARSVDAIVVASVKDKTSLFNEGERFIFTEHQVRVEEVIKNNSLAPINPDSDITITRAGGKIRVDGRTVTAIESPVRPIRVGRTYVLFLKLIGATGGYQSISPFEITGNKIVALNTLLPGFQGERDAAAVIETIRKTAKGVVNK